MAQSTATEAAEKPRKRGFKKWAKKYIGNQLANVVFGGAVAVVGVLLVVVVLAATGKNQERIIDLEEQVGGFRVVEINTRLANLEAQQERQALRDEIAQEIIERLKGQE